MWMPTDGLEGMALTSSLTLEKSTGRDDAKLYKTYITIRTMPKFVVESDIDVRTFVRPFHQRQTIAECATLDEAYQFIDAYIANTKEVFTSFSRNTLCTREDLDKLVGTGQAVAVNIVLGQFEDTLYVNKL